MSPSFCIDYHSSHQSIMFISFVYVIYTVRDVALMALIHSDLDATSFMLKCVFGFDQTQHMFIYPALTWLYPVCHFAWQSLQATHYGTRLRYLWQSLFLIHKSQKDQFKIHEQSVLQQPVISVTVGQWRRGATERKVLPPLIFAEKHTQMSAHTHRRKDKKTNKTEDKVLSITPCMDTTAVQKNFIFGLDLTVDRIYKSQ